MTKINKKRVKECLKQCGYTMIPKSWYDGDTDEERYSAIFNTYDKYGCCHHFYVDANAKCARAQMLGDVVLFPKRNVNYIFEDYFKEIGYEQAE